MQKSPTSEKIPHYHIAGSALGLFLFLLSVSHWLSFSIHFLELFGAFAHFTIIISAIAVGISLYLKQKMLGVFSGISLIISAALVTPHLLPLNHIQKGEFTVGQFNLYHHNTSPELAFSEIQKINADVFTIQELSSDWMPMIDSVFREKYPYQIEEPWDECCYGIGLYSKFPFVDGEVFKTESTPAIQASISVKGKVLRIISFHTKPPALPNETEERNIQMRIVSKMASECAEPLIVLGDLNIVPWDAEFKSFLKTGKLIAARNGFQATFPMDLGFPLIPIDHIMHSNDLSTTFCETSKIPGSDHKGVVASFELE